jgi:hypothetical protein
MTPNGTVAARPTTLTNLLREETVSDHVAALQFSVGQVCQLAGITKMQLDYWTARAAITTHGKVQRLYDADGVRLVLLMKQARELGFDVKTSVRMVREFVAIAEAGTDGVERAA